MIGRGVIEQAYSFFHQKLRVYEFSHSETQRDDIEYAVSAYVDGMSSELYGVLSGGCPDYLRSHASFEGDIRDAVSRMEEMLCKAAYGLMEYNLGHGFPPPRQAGRVCVSGMRASASHAWKSAGNFFQP